MKIVKSSVQNSSQRRKYASTPVVDTAFPASLDLKTDLNRKFVAIYIAMDTIIHRMKCKLSICINTLITAATIPSSALHQYNMVSGFN